MTDFCTYCTVSDNFSWDSIESDYPVHSTKEDCESNYPRGYVTTVKAFNDNHFVVTQLKHRKALGSDILSGKVKSAIEKTDTEHTSNHIHRSKLKQSLVRSRTRTYELAMCNDWEYFCTFTIDPAKYDRYHLKEFYKEFARYVYDLGRCNGFKIEYLLIPEMHKDGAWHMHGLMMGIPRSLLRLFTLEERLPRHIRCKLKKGDAVYDWMGYHHRFGFCDLEYIRDKARCAKYILKYITKDLERCVTEVGAKVYYCSRGLSRPVVVYEGLESGIMSDPSFENEWILRKEYDSIENALDFEITRYYYSFAESPLDDETIDYIVNG